MTGEPVDTRGQHLEPPTPEQVVDLAAADAELNELRPAEQAELSGSMRRCSPQLVHPAVLPDVAVEVTGVGSPKELDREFS